MQASTSSKTVLGEILIITAADCDLKKLQWPILRISLRTLLKNSTMTEVKSQWHKFSPDGITATFILKESHLACHTWPERKITVLELFCCRKISKPKNLTRLIGRLLGSKKISWSKKTIAG